MEKKIMIVEDSGLMKAVISNFIKKELEDAKIIKAGSGDEAIKRYEEQNPDLVFMDIKMPGMDGITALENIMKHHPDAKVIMCTSLKEPEQEERAKKSGCKGYILKPFSSKDIIDALRSNL